jgi:hypothetical protein
MPHRVWVSKQLGRPVIKAFNNTLAYSLAELGRPEGSPGRLAIAVAGNDAKSKQIVMDVVNETGFDAVDAGSLDESWRQEPGTPSYCCDFRELPGLSATDIEAAANRVRPLSELRVILAQPGSHCRRSLNPCGPVRDVSLVRRFETTAINPLWW